MDLGVAKPGDALRFGQHGGRGAGALLAARVRNNAVGAELVAAFDDGDVAAVRIGPRGELGVEGLVGLAVVETSDAGLPRLKPVEHLRQVPIAGRTGDQRDVGRALEDALAFLLSDAAEDAEELAFALHLLVLVQPVKDLLLRLIADGTGVIEDQVGVSLVDHLGIALLLQRADHLFGVVRIHLAAKSL